MEFKRGTTVFTQDGQKVGTIDRFVLDPRGQKVIGLVVRRGFLFTEDRVVPLRTIQSATEDKVILAGDVNDPDSFPVFETTHYVSPEGEELNGPYRSDEYAPLYYYPAPAMGFGWYGGVAPIAPAEVPVTERNVPEGSVALKVGANVISSNGDHVGDVDRVFVDPRTQQITHFAITQGLIFKDVKTLPANWIESANDDEVHLAVGSKTLEKLAAN